MNVTELECSKPWSFRIDFSYDVNLKCSVSENSLLRTPSAQFEIFFTSLQR